MPRNIKREDYQEKVDPMPIEIPLGRDRPQSFKDELMEQVRYMVQQEKNQDFESPDEFWDLDIDEDRDPFETSGYELLDMDEEYVDPMLDNQENIEHNDNHSEDRDSDVSKVGDIPENLPSDPDIE